MLFLENFKKQKQKTFSFDSQTIFMQSSITHQVSLWKFKDNEPKKKKNLKNSKNLKIINRELFILELMYIIKMLQVNLFPLYLVA